MEHARQSLSRRGILGLMGAAAVVGGFARPAPALASSGQRRPNVRRRDLLRWVDEQVDFICSKQLASGAILAPDDMTITPYFASWGLMGLARVNDRRSRTAIGRYLEWYLAHLNSAEQDPYGIPGTVFVYTYDSATGTETSTGAYSSIDAGVATPVMVARDAWATGDQDLRALVLDNIESWELMLEADLAAAPRGVLQPNGLCLNRPGGVMYLQDNCVVYQGLLALAELEDRLGRRAQAARCRTAAGVVRDSLMSTLWDTANQNWSWAMAASGSISRSDPTRRFYPDGWCQYWPVILDITAPSSTYALASWQSVVEAYPHWTDLENGNDYPHTEMAIAGAKMGKDADVVAMLQSIRDKYAPLDWGSNWYVGEAGHFIRAALLVAPGCD